MRSVEQFIKIPPRQIEAAIAAMRRDRWTRFQAEQWVGLPTGTLAAVVDDQGRWLNQIVMSLAVNHLPPAMLQVFFERINGIRDSLRMQGLEPPAADDHAPVQGSGDVERAQIHLNRPASNEWPSDTRHSAAATISIERTTQREHATSHSRTGPSDTGRALDLPDLNLPAPEEPLPDSNQCTTLAVRRDLPAMPSIDVQATQMPVQELWGGSARTIVFGHEREDEQVQEAQVREILDVVARQNTKRAFYKAILKANDERPPERRWSDKSMRMAAQIGLSNAWTVRTLVAPDTPRTIEVREFLDSSVPTNKKDSASRRYRRALDENARKGEPKWPDKSMQKAAGIEYTHAARIREFIAPDTPRTIEVREFLRSSVPEGRADRAIDRYRRALEKNAEPQQEPKWPEKSMQKAAGIFGSEALRIREHLAPDTPRTRSVREFLKASAPTDGPDNFSDKYRRALEQNRYREEDQKWPDKSMQKAAGVNPANATRIRESWIAKHTANDPQARDATSRQG